MKSFIISFVFCIFMGTMMFAQTGPPACDDFVTLQGKHFQCGGQLFYPLVASYCFHAVFSGNPETIAPLDTSLFSLARHGTYGPCENPDCFGGCGQYESCTRDTLRAYIDKDLHVIHEKGFNTISTRLGPGYKKNSNDTMYLPTMCCEPLGCGVSVYDMPIHADLNDPGDPGLNKWFRLIKEILQLAHKNDLKVLLDVGYGGLTDPDHIDSYIDYLELLAQYITTLDLQLRQTLIAYVIMEEPGLTQQYQHPKSQVCEKIARMYDALKDHDEEHLVTVGGQHLVDLFQWDPGVMKLDFWSPHIYPEYDRYDRKGEGSSDQAVERVKGQLFWLKNNCPIPWMIGETGFGAIDDDQGWPAENGDPGWNCGYLGYPLVNGELETPLQGTTYTQKNYAENILAMVRDCGGAGYTQWGVYEGWAAHPVYNPDINGNSWGMFRHGEASTGLTDKDNYLGLQTTIFKPVVAIFESYLSNGQPPAVNSNGGQMPASYYNPYQHPTVNNYGCPDYRYHHVSGTVTDQNNQPIKDAFIYAWVDVGFNEDDDHIFDVIYTFSDESGDFSINARNWDVCIGYHDNIWAIIDVHVTVTGGEKVEAGWGAVSSVYNPVLERTDLKMDAEFDNITVSNAQTRNFYAWNSLSMSDIDIQSGATSEIKAMTEVQLSSEFNANTGSEVHIWCAAVFPDCNDFQNFKSLNVSKELLSDEEINTAEIRIQFAKEETYLAVSPNPGHGIFSISLKSNTMEKMQRLLLLDYCGRKLLEKEVNATEIREDFSAFPRGIYIVQASDETGFLYSQRIVIQ